MTPHAIPSQAGSSGNMPSLSLRSASLRTGSLSNASDNTTATGPFARRGSATLDALTRSLKRKSGVEVVLDGKDEFVRTYSTFDKIQGQVNLNLEKDTLIGDLVISLEGLAQTYVEKLATASPTSGRASGRHTFLRVLQPIFQESLPENMLAKANITYTIPFTFVVPDRLLPHICSHKTEHDEVKAAHLQLPPSIGDPMLSGTGNVLMDDLAPDMAKISYYVKARVSKASPSTGKVTDIEEKLARIRIIPAREEEPPLPVDENNSFYCLRKEKNVRKGVFKIGKKLGRLTAEVAQPKSLRQPAFTSTSKTPVTTMATVTLRFDPTTEQEQPPQLGSLSAKLKAHTFFGAAAYKILPEVSKFDNWSTLHGMYPETVSLSCRNVGSVVWSRHDPDKREKSIASSSSGMTTLSRRDSNFSTSSSHSSSSSASVPIASAAYDSSLPFYTAKVLVPISLPQGPEADEHGPASKSISKGPLKNNKRITFVPSFHTCIVSRSYALELGLSFSPVSNAGSGKNALSASSVTLRTPIQISQEGSSLPPIDDDSGHFNLGLVEGTDEYDEAMARHLDQELNFSNPFTGGSIEAIPEYEEIQTIFPQGETRHASIAVPPSAITAREQPPEYYSPFSTATVGRGNVAAAGAGLGFVRRVSTRLRS
ncbi:hypothetical protein LTR64_008216 [Lithohypha guttulata]|uniref:uncharacterized protein n=1 Tax=Lithohypha guttulata TaxID=1690604 RepID=UPI002DDF4529|nr:hypothetical protein LTR51_008368 [Lithohypha guttulata]